MVNLGMVQSPNHHCFGDKHPDYPHEIPMRSLEIPADIPWYLPMRSPEICGGFHTFCPAARWKEVATLSTYILVALVVLDLAFLCAFFLCV